MRIKEVLAILSVSAYAKVVHGLLIPDKYHFYQEFVWYYGWL